MEPAVYKWINFVIFVGLLVYFLREPLRDFLGDRRERLRKELEEVGGQRLQAETRYNGYRKRLAQAAQEISQLKEDLRQEGELEKEILIRRAREYAQKIRDDAVRIADQELGCAKELLRHKTLALALDLARKRIEETLNPEDQKRLILWGIEGIARSMA